MNYIITQNTVFSLAEVTLSQNEEMQIKHGSMAYHNGDILLEGKMNSDKGGIGGVMKAIGRSLTSGESFFITYVKGLRDGAKIAIAPPSPGAIMELNVGERQWYIRDRAFLACDSTVSYEMKRQSVGKAILGTGGLYIMETKGSGKMLISSFGDIQEVALDGSYTFIVNNSHTVAWDTSLEHEVKAASGKIGFTTGGGFVNEFQGVGTVFVQTRSLRAFATLIIPYMPRNSSSSSSSSSGSSKN